MLNFKFTALSKTDDKSDSSSEETDWKEMFFTVFFDDDDSNEQNGNSSTSSPTEINPFDFADRLNDDIEKAYKRRCKKISGSDDTFAKVKAAYTELGKCLKTFSHDEELKSASSKLETNDDIKLLLTT